ncbi:hypothetical protein CXB65_11315 [Pseudomonas monteilii]|uniref:Uncharacterized protein n=1 Tax=Pseudomonas monteilii TaxID=76759 RepID=A0A2N1ITB5_9PSED|nr:hypothetical protein B7H19_04830 [Pseudomonas putida]PKI23948.1 hypothetical protein CXB65_11315 [Pseudomonas monteilii]RPD92988.1 hypothetical protein EGN69_23790 [Pseudomonas monteilii]
MIEKHGATRAGHEDLRWQGGIRVLWPFAGTTTLAGAALPRRGPQLRHKTETDAAVSSSTLPPVNARHSYLCHANHSFG